VDGQAVVLLARGMLDRTVVDVGTCVIADGSRRGGLDAETQVGLVGAEHHSVEIVDGSTVEAARLDDPLHGRHQVGHRGEPEMAERDEGFDGFQLDLEAHRVPKRAIGIREGMEQIRAHVATCRYHVARPGEDVHLQHRFVGQAVAERRRLDAEARYGSAEGDGLQLRHHQWREPVRQGGGDQVLVGTHARHVGGALVRIDGDHAGQPRNVQALGGRLLPGAEQVRRGLGQSYGGVWRNGAIARQQSLHACCVGRLRFDGCNSHTYTLVPSRIRCDRTHAGSHPFIPLSRSLHRWDRSAPPALS
jgi:hypothetical protein